MTTMTLSRSFDEAAERLRNANDFTGIRLDERAEVRLMERMLALNGPSI